MGTVRLNEAALGRLLNSTIGPVGQDIARRADNVKEIATQNAQGAVIGMRSRALLQGIRAQLTGGPDGVEAVISTDAKSTWAGSDFSYPAFHDVAGEGLPGGGENPWLTSALREGFDL